MRMVHIRLFLTDELYRNCCKLKCSTDTVQEANVNLRFRVGALFFVILSLSLFYLMVVGWTHPKNGINNEIIPLVVLTITYFVGGGIALTLNNRKGMLSIFVVNLLALIAFSVFFLLLVIGYLTDPCYIDPSSCDDQLTDTPMYLKAFGIITVLFALMTYMSWRLQRVQMIGESKETEDE